MRPVTRTALAAQIDAATRDRGRIMVAVAGPPGSGKSTVAEALAGAVAAPAQVVPMDGFHLENDVLRARGLLPRKGAPETFDCPGLLALLRRIRQGGAVPYPTFDRVADRTLPEGGRLREETKVVLVEGNYLLLDAPCWREIAQLWDVTIWLEVPHEELEARLTQRWLDHGLSREQAGIRARGNDMVNADRVIAGSLTADHVVTNAGDADQMQKAGPKTGLKG